MRLVLILAFIVFTFNACSSNTYDRVASQIAGNEPPKFYKIANIQTMNDYVFDMKDYSVSPPLASKKDFTLLGGWEGATHYGKDFTIYLDAPLSYHISVSSSITQYTEEDKQLELFNNDYFKNKYKTRVHDFGHGHVETSRLNVHLKKFGKENYPCFVSEIRDEIRKKTGEKLVKYKTMYRCHKFNPSRTKTKSVIVTLTYSKAPNIPVKYYSLAKQYTYEDLKRRAKRTLDSLYIKDNW